MDHKVRDPGMTSATGRRTFLRTRVGAAIALVPAARRVQFNSVSWYGCKRMTKRGILLAKPMTGLNLVGKL